jgi:hypothetical protein
MEPKWERVRILAWVSSVCSLMACGCFWFLMTENEVHNHCFVVLGMAHGYVRCGGCICTFFPISSKQGMAFLLLLVLGCNLCSPWQKMMLKFCYERYQAWPMEWWDRFGEKKCTCGQFSSKLGMAMCTAWNELANMSKTIFLNYFNWPNGLKMIKSKSQLLVKLEFYIC